MRKVLKKTADEWEMPDLSNLKSTKARNFVFIVYPESAPADWLEKLLQSMDKLGLIDQEGEDYGKRE